MEIFPKNNIGKIITGHICAIVCTGKPLPNVSKSIGSVKTAPVYKKCGVKFMFGCIDELFSYQVIIGENRFFIRLTAIVIGIA